MSFIIRRGQIEAKQLGSDLAWIHARPTSIFAGGEQQEWQAQSSKNGRWHRHASTMRLSSSMTELTRNRNRGDLMLLVLALDVFDGE